MEKINSRIIVALAFYLTALLASNTLGLKSIVGYKKTGKVIPNYSNTNSYVQMQDAIPGTMGEAYVDSVCS